MDSMHKWQNTMEHSWYDTEGFWGTGGTRGSWGTSL